MGIFLIFILNFVAFYPVEQVGTRYLLVDVKGSDTRFINSVGKKKIYAKNRNAILPIIV